MRQTDAVASVAGAGMFTWLTQGRMARLGFIGGAIAALAVGGWTVFTYFDKPGTGLRIKFTACLGMARLCPSGTVHVPATADEFPNWVKNECKKYKPVINSTEKKDNNILIEVECTSGPEIKPK